MNHPISKRIEAEQPLTVPQIAQLEYSHRKDAAQFASIDAALAMKGIVASGLMETLQTEHQARAVSGEAPLADIDGLQGFLFQDLPHLPLDWKAVGLSLGAYVATSAVKRSRDYEAYGRELGETFAAAQGSLEFTPHTPRSLKRFQRTQRVKRATATVVAMSAAYKIGENLTTIQNMLAGGSVALAGAVSPRIIDKVRARQQSTQARKHRATRSPSNAVTAYSVTHRPELMAEYDPELNPNRYS